MIEGLGSSMITKGVNQDQCSEATRSLIFNIQTCAEMYTLNNFHSDLVPRDWGASGTGLVTFKCGCSREN